MYSSFYRYLSTGFAMFSMFFGAGNVIFPLVVGQATGDQLPSAILGLLLTAVGVPFMGLVAIILFQGCYENFFYKIGKVPGFVVITIIMLLIGPFGAMPRCIALSYSTLKTSWPTLSFSLFSLSSCVVIFLCTFRKNRIIDLLGTILTPLLLISLLVIVVAGLMTPDALVSSAQTNVEAFTYGLMEGYNTMDLLASFFFSAVIYNSLKNASDDKNERKIFSMTLKSSLIGAGLLGIVYIGFSLVAAYHAKSLPVDSQDQLLGMLTLKILGPYAGLFAATTIALACLTTAIALATVFAEFLQKRLFGERISYLQALLLTLLTTYGVSTLEFKGIATLLTPVLQVIYPALIVLTFVNIIYRLYNFKKIEA